MALFREEGALHFLVVSFIVLSLRRLVIWFLLLLKQCLCRLKDLWMNPCCTKQKSWYVMPPLPQDLMSTRNLRGHCFLSNYAKEFSRWHLSLAIFEVPRTSNRERYFCFFRWRKVQNNPTKKKKDHRSYIKTISSYNIYTDIVWLLFRSHLDPS